MNATTPQPPQADKVTTLYQAVLHLLDEQLQDFSQLQRCCEDFRQQIERMLRPATGTSQLPAATVDPSPEYLSEKVSSSSPTDADGLTTTQRERFATDFRDLLHRIQQQQDNLQHRLSVLEQSMGQVMSPPVNLTRFMQLLQTEQQLQIRTRRTALFDKLLAVRSIMVGSHLVLGYRLEFYQQLISALSGQTSLSSCYSPLGTAPTSETGTLIERDC